MDRLTRNDNGLFMTKFVLIYTNKNIFQRDCLYSNFYCFYVFNKDIFAFHLFTKRDHFRLI